jgi:hypothetical protein
MHKLIFMKQQPSRYIFMNAKIGAKRRTCRKVTNGNKIFRITGFILCQKESGRDIAQAVSRWL